MPSTTFPAARVADAFRHFASGRHIGKVVVDIESAGVDVRSAIADGTPFDADGTYLVTGGTRGFGLAVGRWLAARGAGRVVLASRSGMLDGETLSCSPDSKLEALSLDVTRAADVECAITSLARGEKPLRGIFHAAVTYDDAMLADMTPDAIDRVLAPKIAGALNLTRAVESAGAQLDHFVTFSSLAQVVGWPGQSNYAAANGFLEALASWQRARGIPGQCINWGALGESGHVARSAQMQGYLDSSGWIAMNDATALGMLARALDSDLPSVTVAAADWQRLAPYIRRSRGRPGCRGLLAQELRLAEGRAGTEPARRFRARQCRARDRACADRPRAARREGRHRSGADAGGGRHRFAVVVRAAQPARAGGRARGADAALCQGATHRRAGGAARRPRPGGPATRARQDAA